MKFSASWNYTRGWLLIVAISATSLSLPAQAYDLDSVFAKSTPIHFFAAGGWGMDDQGKLDTARRGYDHGFNLENLDLYIAPDMGDRTKFLAEVALEPGFNDQQIGIDTERLQFGYTFSNFLTAWVGRFHTPLGYYIIAYHHAHQLATAAEKPLFLDFEDHWGVVPIHTTGLWLTGQALFDAGRLAYMAWMGNGSRFGTDTGSALASNGSAIGISTLDMNMGHDDNLDTAFGGRVAWFFPGLLDGLQAGFSYLHERVDYQGNNSTGGGAAITPVDTAFRTQLQLGVAHVVYENYGVEFLNELFLFHNKNALTAREGSLDENTHDSTAGYSQLAYWFGDKWAPFVRYEWGDFSQKDAYFATQYNGLPYDKEVLGARYNLSEAACVKLELSRKRILASSYNATLAGNPTIVPAGSISDIHVQFAYSF